MLPIDRQNNFTHSAELIDQSSTYLYLIVWMNDWKKEIFSLDAS